MHYRVAKREIKFSIVFRLFKTAMVMEKTDRESIIKNVNCAFFLLWITSLLKDILGTRRTMSIKLNQLMLTSLGYTLP